MFRFCRHCGGEKIPGRRKDTIEWPTANFPIVTAFELSLLLFVQKLLNLQKVFAVCAMLNLQKCLANVKFEFNLIFS